MLIGSSSCTTCTWRTEARRDGISSARATLPRMPDGSIGRRVREPPVPQLGPERGAQVEPPFQPQLVEDGGPVGGDVEGHLRAEALAELEQPGPAALGHGGDPVADPLQDQRLHPHPGVGLVQRQRAGHEGVLRHDDGAVAAGQVLQGLGERVVHVAHARGGRDDDHGLLVGPQGIELGQGQVGARLRGPRTLEPRDGPDRVDGRFAHHIGDLVGDECHQDEPAALLADVVERDQAGGARRHRPARRGVRVGRLDHVVGVLDPPSQAVEGDDSGGEHERCGDRVAHERGDPVVAAAQGAADQHGRALGQCVLRAGQDHQAGTDGSAECGGLGHPHGGRRGAGSGGDHRSRRQPGRDGRGH